MYEAWNYLGYCNRKLGKYDAALAAYDRALQLKPDYPEAIEYRGHAYLGFNRLSEAQGRLPRAVRVESQAGGPLLAAMQAVDGRPSRQRPAWTGSFDSFASWVSERSAIASQTASLTREGANAAW